MDFEGIACNILCWNFSWNVACNDFSGGLLLGYQLEKWAKLDFWWFFVVNYFEKDLQVEKNERAPLQHVLSTVVASVTLRNDLDIQLFFIYRSAAFGRGAAENVENDQKWRKMMKKSWFWNCFSTLPRHCARRFSHIWHASSHNVCGLWGYQDPAGRARVCDLLAETVDGSLKAYPHKWVSAFRIPVGKMNKFRFFGDFSW